MQIQPPTTIEEAIRLLLHYIGIVKITEDNIQTVYKRSKQLQVIMLGGGFWEGRLPYLKELENHIGYVSDAPLIHSDKKWKKVLLDELFKMANQMCVQEEEHLANEEEEESKEHTVNEENKEAHDKLEDLIASQEVKEEKEKYPH